MDQNLNFHNHPGSVHMRQQSHKVAGQYQQTSAFQSANLANHIELDQEDSKAAAGMFHSHLRESINSTSTLGRQEVADEDQEMHDILVEQPRDVFTDRTNMMVNP